MGEDVENTTIERLKDILGELAHINQKQDEYKQQLGRIEMAISSVKRDVAHGEAGADQRLKFDQLSKRIERLERRLEING